METIKKKLFNRLLQFLSNEEQFVFLDTSKPVGDNNKSLLFLRPVERIQYREGEDEKEFLIKIENFQSQGLYVAGWMSYEFGCLLEPSLKKQLCRPEDKGALLADFGVFPKPFVFNHNTGETDFPLGDTPLGDNNTYKVKNLLLSQKREEYLKAIDRVLEYISAGDTYQVNYTLKLLFDFHGSPEFFYRELRRNQSVSYGAYIRWGEERILSFSPELFFWKKESKVKVRPMKGTLRRGLTLKEDKKNRVFLAEDIKNRSENVMIVDLLRNDLGRLMHYIVDGDVKVDSLFDVEVFETLLQMTSTVTGVASKNALSDISLHNFLKAIFPCGSVTGAPKIRTMQIIDELEKERRGVYTGAIGYMSPSGEAVFNVPIRTVVLNGARGEMGIGSGIVHDSEPENEWQECLLKGKFLTHPQEEFQLIETLLWHPEEGYWLLENHLKRLEKSAAFFLFECDRKDIEGKLLERSSGFIREYNRVRLTLEKDGTFAIEVIACNGPRHLQLPGLSMDDYSRLAKIAISSESVEKNNVWVYHKTTKRGLYNREYQNAQKHGFFDVIFSNEENEITEGCISNIIVYKDGEYLTPSLSSGLLAGVMREHLMKETKRPVVERILKLKDLQQADALYCCNSVRGVVRVDLVEDAAVIFRGDLQGSDCKAV